MTKNKQRNTHTHSLIKTHTRKHGEPNRPYNYKEDGDDEEKK